MNTAAIKMTGTQETQNKVQGKLSGEFKLKGILAGEENVGFLQGVHIKFLLPFPDTENQGKLRNKVYQSTFFKKSLKQNNIENAENFEGRNILPDYK